MAIVAPSILAANFGRFEEDVQSVIAHGVDWIHIDVMDGHFVPPITFGPDLVKALRKTCEATLDVHLMVSNPQDQIDPFAEAGADIITVHLEAAPHLHRLVQKIHSHGKKAGVAINPGTDVSLLKPVVAEVDLVLIMTVNPGWGGQKFIPLSTERVAEAKELIAATGRDIDLQVDGGINDKTGKLVVDAGANVLVAGTYVFGGDRPAAIKSLAAL